MMGDFEFDYRRALRQAKQLDEVAEKIRRIATSDVEHTIAILRSGWEGDATNQYCAKAGKLKTKIEKISVDLKRSAETIRTIAKIIYEAEKAAAAIAAM